MSLLISDSIRGSWPGVKQFTTSRAFATAAFTSCDGVRVPLHEAANETRLLVLSARAATRRAFVKCCSAPACQAGVTAYLGLSCSTNRATAERKTL